MRVDGSNLPPLSSFVGGCARLDSNISSILLRPASVAEITAGYASPGRMRLGDARPVGKAVNPQDTRITPVSRKG